MKFHTKRIRRLRRLALAGCIVAVVAPSSAFAMLPDRGPARNDVQQQQPQQQYTLPSGFRTEVQTTAPQAAGVTQFTLNKGFRPEVQTSAPAQASTPTVVHQIETVSDNSGKTLAIVLASIALAVALASLAYASIRLHRRELGSH